MNIFINKAVWNKFTPEEMENFKSEVFKYYREYGFPYFNLTQEEKTKVFEKLKNFDTKKILLPNFELNQDMLGLNLQLADFTETFMFRIPYITEFSQNF